MAAFRIAVIGGDGIGPEVIAQAVRVTERAARHDRAEIHWNHLAWGMPYYTEHGRILPVDGWDTLQKHDAILFGAIGSPDVPEAVTAHELLLPMRRRFDQYVNLRPSVLYDGVPCPLRDRRRLDRHRSLSRKHRGRVCTHRRTAVCGHAGRVGNSDGRVHPPRL